MTLPERRSGVVVPSSALVDDGGTSVAYVQIDGEGFLRQEVRIDARQGAFLLVRGVEPGERVVTIGGSAIPFPPMTFALAASVTVLSPQV